MTMELLENRSLLSNVTVSFPTPSSPLTITGDIYNDNFTITENADGTVTVAGASTSRVVPGVGVVPPSTIDGLAAPFTTDSAVTSIIINLPGVNNFDFVTLYGAGKTTPVTVRDVTVTATGANLNFSASQVNNSGDFVLSNTYTPGSKNAALAVNIEDSSFATLAITQTGWSQSDVNLSNNTIYGNVSVSQGNGDHNSITVGSGNIFGSTTLVQGAGGPSTSFGDSDRISVSNSSLNNLLIKQLLDGADNQIAIDALSIALINPTGPLQGITTIQGNGARALVTVNDVATVTTTTQQIPIRPGFGLSNVVLVQGDGSGDSAVVKSSSVPGSITIKQGDILGNPSGDTALVSDVTVGYAQGTPIIDELVGNISIIQGDALDIATVVNSIAVGDVSISQGNGGGTSTSAAGDHAVITNVTAGVAIGDDKYGGNLIITQGTGSGASATVSGTTAVGNLSIHQSDESTNPFGNTVAIIDGTFGGDIAITQGAASGDSADITPSAVGGDVSITQGDGDGDVATVKAPTVGGNVFITQGDGNEGFATTSIDAVGGDVSITQGDGDGDVATVSGSTAVGDVFISQGSGNGDSAHVIDMTVAGNITIVQTDVAGNATGNNVKIIGVTAGSTVLAGQGITTVDGIVTVTQGSASGDLVLLDGDSINSIAITQGDNVQRQTGGAIESDVVEIKDTNVTSNLSIIQGTGTSDSPFAGYYVASIGFDYLGLIGGAPESGSVTVGGATYIDQNYAQNQIFMGDPENGSIGVTTTFLDAFLGSRGGAYVQVANTQVVFGPLGIFSSYNFDASGAITSSIDEFSSLSVTVDPLITPILTWADPAGITYGTALGPAQLNATTTVPGSFAYSQAAGTVLNAGAGQTLTVTFTPDDLVNYNPVTATVTIDVAPATLLVSVGSATRVYGQENPTFGVTYAGFTNGDSPASLGGTLHVSTAATASSPVGTYSVVASGLTAPNYAIIFKNAELAILPVSLTIIADNQTRVSGDANPQLTAHYLGFVNGDTPASLTSPAILSTPAGLASSVGTYLIDVSGATSPNYVIQFVRGTLSVTAPTNPPVDMIPTNPPIDVAPAKPIVQGRIAFVTSLFNSLLLVSPGPTDIAYWQGQFNAGKSFRYVTFAINRSIARRAVLRSHHGAGISLQSAYRQALKARGESIRMAQRVHRAHRSGAH